MRLKTKERKKLNRQLFLVLDILEAVDKALKLNNKLPLSEVLNVLSKFNLTLRFSRAVWTKGETNG